MLENELQYIEWQDARINRIELHPEGRLMLFFKHICSYHKLYSNKSAVWSSRAVVSLSGVTLFKIDNIISDAYIDGELLDAEGKEVVLLPIQVEKPVSIFKFL